MAGSGIPVRPALPVVGNLWETPPQAHQNPAILCSAKPADDFESLETNHWCPHFGCYFTVPGLMRILYDGEIYSIFKHGGVVRYFHELITGLPQEDQPVILGQQVPSQLPSHPQLQMTIRPPLPLPVRWIELIKPWRKALERRFCNHSWPLLKPDLVHPTYYNEVARGRYHDRRVPLVLTVYDMIHERFPAQVDRRGTHSEKKRAAVAQADHVLCISETTRQDLIERFQIPPERTSVTLLGVDRQHFSSQPTTPPPLKESLRDYFLFVGRRDEYKNFRMLLQAMRELESDAVGTEPPFRLVVVGDPFTPSEQELIHRWGLERWIHWEPTGDDRALQQWYAHSIALIFPSLWEGFGLPLLEAMAAGTCVIASDIPVFRELAEGHFVPFDPYDPSSLAAAMREVSQHPAKRQRLLDLSEAILSRFTWRETVRQTHAVYNSLTSNQR